MPTGRDFSKEQWQEIDEARARLQAYRNKIQPYPAYPDEPLEPEHKVVEHIVRHSQMGAKEFDLLQQTARKLEYLEKKLTEHIEYKRKVPVKAGKGRGIKIE